MKKQPKGDGKENQKSHGVWWEREFLGQVNINVMLQQGQRKQELSHSFILANILKLSARPSARHQGRKDDKETIDNDQDGWDKGQISTGREWVMRKWGSKSNLVI